jgi:hypothetical protein
MTPPRISEPRHKVPFLISCRYPKYPEWLISQNSIVIKKIFVKAVDETRGRHFIARAEA